MNSENKIHEKLQQVKNENEFIRVDSEHKLDIFLGYSNGNKPTMTILDFGDMRKIEPSQRIDAILYKQTDEKVSVSFVLKDTEIYWIFLKFCEDIIESTRNISKIKAIDFILVRWKIWKDTFKNINGNILSESQIIGLLGELIFLKEYLIPKVGEEKAIKSWQGLEMLSKDFEIFDTWYEIKTKTTNYNTIKISSIEQLDSDLEGHLVVIKLRKTNELNNLVITLNNYILEIEKNLENYEVKIEFKNKLLKFGYIVDEKYNQFNYVYEELNVYSVREDFPRIVKSDLLDGIESATYEINIGNIKRFKEESLVANEYTRV